MTRHGVNNTGEDYDLGQWRFIVTNIFQDQSIFTCSLPQVRSQGFYVGWVLVSFEGMFGQHG